MKNISIISQKIFLRNDIIAQAARWKFLGKTIAFTNGIFDLLHDGHIFSLSQAAKEADVLIVGVNSDASTKRLKGTERPVNNEQSRALLLASMIITDAVVVFEEDTPYELIMSIMPDMIVKGGDYTVDQVAGGKEVIANGGKVIINPVLEGYSTTKIISNIKG
ncbi:MAG: adenylyltransferase/cytidyltransferase family protein [Gemmatimonadaceae bacterium]|nr:adenylyltransferase/cytidyltransferase family protein [Chitinophagaceae bacterium]